LLARAGAIVKQARTAFTVWLAGKASVDESPADELNRSLADVTMASDGSDTPNGAADR